MRIILFLLIFSTYGKSSSASEELENLKKINKACLNRSKGKKQKRYLKSAGNSVGAGIFTGLAIMTAPLFPIMPFLPVGLGVAAGGYSKKVVEYTREGVKYSGLYNILKYVSDYKNGQSDKSPNRDFKKLSHEVAKLTQFSEDQIHQDLIEVIGENFEEICSDPKNFRRKSSVLAPYLAKKLKRRHGIQESAVNSSSRSSQSKILEERSPSTERENSPKKKTAKQH